MSLRTRFADAAQALGLTDNNDQNNQDGAPPTQDTPTRNLPPPPYPGAKPRLQDKLEGPGVKEVDKSTWEALEKSKNDEEAQEDLKGIIMKHNSQVYLLLMSKTSAEVMLGHSPFQYFSSKLGKDPYHRSNIIFVKDRTERGDPMPYAVKKEEAKQWGKWKQVTAVSSNMERMLWFEADEDNLLDLYKPDTSENTGTKDTPVAMIAGPETALYVIKERPSAAQLELWAQEREGTEADQVGNWAALASQTTAGSTGPRRSILAHTYDPITEPSRELEEALRDHLNSVLGEAIRPQPGYSQGGNGSAAGQGGSPSSQGGSQHTSNEILEKLTAAVTDTKRSKTKLTDELKTTLAGYCGERWDSEANKEVRERWEELDEARGNEHATMKIALRHLDEVGKDLGIKPYGQLIAYDMFTDMLDGDFLPMWGINEALRGDYSQGISAIRFAEYTPHEIAKHTKEKKAQNDSRNSRSLTEAREIQGKKPKAAPDTYSGVVNMCRGAWRFYATWFGLNSNIADDYEAVVKILDDMANYQSDVPKDSWKTFSWLLINSDRQYFGTRIEERQLARGKGLPMSEMAVDARQLRRYKQLPRVAGAPDDWYSTGDAEEEDRFERRRRPGRDAHDRRGQDQRNEDRQRKIVPHSETHPKVKQMMDPYYKQYEWILGREICEEAGVTFRELDLGNACLNYILGKCTFPGCGRGNGRRHPRMNDASDAQVATLCNKLKPGVDAMTRQRRRRGNGYRRGGDRS